MLSWEELAYQCQRCRGCGLSQRHHVVGQGSHTAQVLCITHTPSESTRVLSPEQWAFFQDLLAIAGLSPEQIYLASVVKCLPPPGREVLHLEQHTCLPWLRNQWTLLQPKMIVCLGQPAVNAIMGEEISVASHHGQWFSRNQMDMMAMEHPATLLRQSHQRPQGFLDAKSLGEKARQLHIL